jgi:hypothetical protein
MAQNDLERQLNAVGSQKGGAMVSVLSLVALVVLVLLHPTWGLAHEGEEIEEEGQIIAPVATEEAPIAGMPYEEAVAIYQRQRLVLKQIEGVQDAGLGDDGIYVYAEESADVPLAVDGLPVKRLPLMGFPVAGRPYLDAAAIFFRHRVELERLPRVQEAGFDAEGIFVYTDQPEQLPISIEGLPVRARDPMGEPIGDFPVMDVHEIYQRAIPALSHLGSVRLGREAIHILIRSATEAELIPKEFEGIPVTAIVYGGPEGAE